MKTPFRKLLGIAALATLVTACAGHALHGGRSATATFLLVRHAEKAVDDTKDPSLSESGRGRALRLAERLKDVSVSAIYATDYRRTQQTAAPTALAHKLAVRTYDAAMPAKEFAARLRTEHATGTVLVVGHSNTTPAIATALCGCDISPLREDEYDRWIAIHADRDGTTTVEEGRY